MAKYFALLRSIVDPMLTSFRSTSKLLRTNAGSSARALRKSFPHYPLITRRSSTNSHILSAKRYERLLKANNISPAAQISPRDASVASAKRPKSAAAKDAKARLKRSVSRLKETTSTTIPRTARIPPLPPKRSESRLRRRNLQAPTSLSRPRRRRKSAPTLNANQLETTVAGSLQTPGSSSMPSFRSPSPNPSPAIRSRLRTVLRRSLATESLSATWP